MSATIAILLCTYNGEQFLQEQLDSFAAQEFKNWELFVYDDGSTDNTKAIVKGFKTKNQNKIHFIPNKKKMGFAKNFLNAVRAAPRNFDFYAFSDQDDIWLPFKLERAVEYLTKIDRRVPALYGSRTTLIDNAGNHIGFSTLFQKKPSFGNALVQSLAGGNTMVFNKATKNLIGKAELGADIVSHDWSVYQFVAGAGGDIYYDPHSEILYRQHSNNIIGANNNFFAKLSRVKMLLAGSFKIWNDRNINALLKNSKMLNEESKDTLRRFMIARENSLILRIVGFLRCGIYRQTFYDNVALFIGGILNRI